MLNAGHNSAERDAVARTYGRTRTHKTLTALGQTALTYEDWITVHTLGFKTWFGDWEAARARQQLFAMSAISLPQTTPDRKALTAGKSKIEAARVTAKIAYKKSMSRGLVSMQDGRSLKLTMVGFKETRRHSADPRVLDLLSNIRAVLTKAVPISHSLPEHVRKSSPTTRAWHYYAAKLDFEGSPAYAKLVIRESINEAIYYDGNLSSLETAVIEQGSAAVPSNKPEAAYLADDKSGLSQLLAGVNSKLISDSVNPQTREPTAEAIRDYERLFAKLPAPLY